MAIRRPPINEAIGSVVFTNPDWLIQDFLYQATTEVGGSDLRYVQVKWDGEVYERVSQSFDYSDPPFVGPEQRGGSIVAQLDYEVNASTRLVTVYNWDINWRDEWPLRLAVNYLTQCLYPTVRGYVIRVVGDQVYNQSGGAIDVANTAPYAFWASEQFVPITNDPNEYLVLSPSGAGTVPSPIPSSYTVTVSPNPAGPGNILYVNVETEGISLGTTLYWKISGPGVTPSFFQSGVTSGKIKVGT